MTQIKMTFNVDATDPQIHVDGNHVTIRDHDKTLVRIELVRSPILSNISPPIIDADEGELQVGERLGVVPAVWSFPVRRAYQWTRNGTCIAGACESTYTLTVEDIFASIGLFETATHETAVLSVPAIPTVPINGRPPTNVGVVKLTGETVVDETLYLSDVFSSWEGDGDMIPVFQWIADGVRIPTETNDSLRLSEEYIGKYIQAKVKMVSVWGQNETRTCTVGPIRAK